jgi:hypothetical protein
MAANPTREPAAGNASSFTLHILFLKFLVLVALPCASTTPTLANDTTTNIYNSYCPCISLVSKDEYLATWVGNMRYNWLNINALS